MNNKNVLDPLATKVCEFRIVSQQCISMGNISFKKRYIQRINFGINLKDRDLELAKKRKTLFEYPTRNHSIVFKRFEVCFLKPVVVKEHRMKKERNVIGNFVRSKYPAMTKRPLEPYGNEAGHLFCTTLLRSCWSKSQGTEDLLPTSHL
ncbi:hypothetical protein CEXT_306321 [Caerostris extrusa]|uniref:Uncharacterized protein n=1 Tax=Caerostris extrusa TaxID=172846 RepID=A0AAV4NEH5_CAEEX|nr:hypothetical protein CEXT_306321 [Caerostris extrusa]